MDQNIKGGFVEENLSPEAFHLYASQYYKCILNRMQRDWKAFNRAEESTFAQAYFSHHKNEVLTRLRECCQPDEVADTFVETMRRYEQKIEELRAECRLTTQKLAKVEEELARARERLAEV